MRERQDGRPGERCSARDRRAEGGDEGAGRGGGDAAAARAGLGTRRIAAELGIGVSLRTVERAVAPVRRELAAEALATVRFETPPSGQMQIDFGECGVALGVERVRVHLFVATLGYSRR